MIDYILSASLFVFFSSTIIFANTDSKDLFNLVFWFIIGTLGGMYSVELIKVLLK